MGIRANDEITHNSAVKIEATKGREMNMSNSGKTAAQSTLSLDLDISVYMGTAGDVYPSIL